MSPELLTLWLCEKHVRKLQCKMRGIRYWIYVYFFSISQHSRRLEHHYVITLTFHMEHDEFISDRVGVDGTTILSPVLPRDVTDHECPLRCPLPHDAESCIIHDLPIFERQRDLILVRPRDLMGNYGAFNSESEDVFFLNIEVN